MGFQKNITELKRKGITFIPGVYSQKQCKEYISLSENIIKKFIKKKKPMAQDCQLIENPFRHDMKYLGLIYNQAIDKILTKLLDNQYVLINSNIINRKLRNDVIKGGKGIGETWHTDSRYLGGIRLDKGFSYIAITMLDDFTLNNASTLYVPSSHLKRSIPERHKNYKCKQILGKAGTLAIFDSGLWHRGGISTYSNRWSMYSYYGPWFVKPYFRYPEMLGEKFGKKLSKPFRRLFHYTSTPPLNEDERTNTVIEE